MGGRNASCYQHQHTGPGLGHMWISMYKSLAGVSVDREHPICVWVSFCVGTCGGTGKEELTGVLSDYLASAALYCPQMALSADTGWSAVKLCVVLQA